MRRQGGGKKKEKRNETGRGEERPEQQEERRTSVKLSGLHPNSCTFPDPAVQQLGDTSTTCCITDRRRNCTNVPFQSPNSIALKINKFDEILTTNPTESLCLLLMQEINISHFFLCSLKACWLLKE